MFFTCTWRPPTSRRWRPFLTTLLGLSLGLSLAISAHCMQASAQAPRQDLDLDPALDQDLNPAPRLDLDQDLAPLAEHSAHATYVELGGMGVLYSVNYEYRPIEWLALRVGVEAFPIFESMALIVPVAVYGLLGGDGHYLELGLGYTGLYGFSGGEVHTDDDGHFLVPQLGYRYQPPGAGFFFRATFTPLTRLNKPDDILPMPGLSFGGTWGRSGP